MNLCMHIIMRVYVHMCVGCLATNVYTYKLLVGVESDDHRHGSLMMKEVRNKQIFQLILLHDFNWDALDYASR